MVTPTTWKNTLKIAVTPFKIGIAPVLLIIAGLDAISFRFYVALDALTPVWLQLPIKAGGIYGWDVTQNAACNTVLKSHSTTGSASSSASSTATSSATASLSS